MNVSLSGSGSIVERAIGFVRLDSPTYEDVERDTNATTQAAIIVGVAALATAIGGLGEGSRGFIGGLVAAVLGWVVVSAVVYFVGTRLIASSQTEADFGQVLRTLGFAQVLGVVNIIGFIPVLGVLAALASGIWGIVMTVKAIKQSLEMSTGRAIATALIAWIVSAVIIGILYSILGVDMGVTGS